MLWRVLLALALIPAAVFILGVSQPAHAQDTTKKLMTVYDRGTTRVFLTSESTIGQALKSENILLDAHDAVEPDAKQTLLASSYQVNIYRARPVVVVDGAIRIKTVSPYQTAAQITSDVGIVMNDEDTTTLHPLTDFLTDGAGLELTIKRARIITLDLYSKKTDVRTQAGTVGAMLKEKGITLSATDRLVPAPQTPISAGMTVRIYREGKQTISVDQDIPVSTRIVYDADQPLGYRAVQTKGVPGNRSISYQVEIKDGNEISRQELVNIITRNPTEQTEVIGLRNDGVGLTKGKGAQVWTDSKGVSHRETYYDLNMSVVMQSCGQGGRYTVRPDGAKVDTDGYIIIAANFAVYPKCSIVETSIGPAKVYDTGGFVTKFPYGYDLATDWSTADGI